MISVGKRAICCLISVSLLFLGGLFIFMVACIAIEEVELDLKEPSKRGQSSNYQEVEAISLYAGCHFNFDGI